MVGPDRTEDVVHHCHGLVGSMTGALALLSDIFPDARTRFEATPGAVPPCRARIRVAPNFAAPFIGVGHDLANATLAATLRAVAVEDNRLARHNDNNFVLPIARVIA